MPATVNDVIGEISERVGDVELERVTKEQVLELINAAARDLRGSGVLRPLDDETTVLVAATFEYVVPANFTFIEELWLESATDGLFDRRILRNQWVVGLVGTTPTLLFDPDLFTITATRQVKIVGWQRPSDTYVIGAGNIDEGLEAFVRERATSYAARQLSEAAEGEVRASLEGIAASTAEESRLLLTVLLGSPHYRPTQQARKVPLR